MKIITSPDGHQVAFVMESTLDVGLLRSMGNAVLPYMYHGLGHVLLAEPSSKDHSDGYLCIAGGAVTDEESALFCEEIHNQMEADQSPRKQPDGPESDLAEDIAPKATEEIAYLRVDQLNTAVSQAKTGAAQALEAANVAGSHSTSALDSATQATEQNKLVQAAADRVQAYAEDAQKWCTQAQAYVEDAKRSAGK